MSKDEYERVDVTVKRNTKDLFAFTKLVPERKKRIQNASAEPIRKDPMNKLAHQLHPIRQYLVIDKIIDNTKTTKTFKLIPDPDSETKQLAYFRPGQYLSLKVKIDDELITRPYSISSSPREALEGYYEITIKKEEDDGFLTPYIWKNWKIGTKIETSGPEGFFYYEPLRDSEKIVGLAGGSGITPFRSLAKSIANEDIEANLTILYGCSDEDDIVFHDELKTIEMENPEKVKLILILSCEEVSLEGCETGFITSEIIKKYTDPENSSFFICGPQIMYEFVEKELEALNLKPKQIRREAFGEIKNISEFPGFPKEVIDKAFTLKVHIGSVEKDVPAKATESVLIALERAELAPPSKCRSGECGFCRSHLLKGDIFVNPISDWRRDADKKFNYFHPCASYPLSDLEIVVPRD
ncbi:MAG: 2Fe-2S iron-sulfur cluster binding domain-containing protein [Candidatus Lokiarchaeota archaeon]|nr:2Fe-2S iron-sulfur cluster binding domain-containing protein [Candidatus Lokiarchaeota archaeon]MBD3198401.1 2Fe-2S iron-sulfur cluster binding domain-containing protein [Candidatus Lokiarchaeota archaeon]